MFHFFLSFFFFWKQKKFVSCLGKAIAPNAKISTGQKSFNEVELESILRFVVYTALVTPPNYKWQEFLERKFPSRTPVNGPPPDSKAPEKQSKAVVKDRLNLTNTAAKFLLDQSLSAPLNTVAFLYLMGGMTFQSNAQIWNNIQNVSLHHAREEGEGGG